MFSLVQEEVGPGLDAINVCRERCLAYVNEPLAAAERVFSIEGRFLRPEDLT